LRHVQPERPKAEGGVRVHEITCHLLDELEQQVERFRRATAPTLDAFAMSLNARVIIYSPHTKDNPRTPCSRVVGGRPCQNLNRPSRPTGSLWSRSAPVGRRRGRRMKAVSSMWSRAR